MFALNRPDRMPVPDSPLFAGCTERESRALSRLGTTVSVDAATTITPEGRPGREFFVIQDGRATCTVRGVAKATFGQGDFFGEMALLDGGPRTATITADSPMRLVVYSATEFNDMLDNSVRVRHRLLVEMARRLRAADAAA